MRQKTASSKMRIRMRVVLALFMLLGFTVIISQLFMIQIVHGEMYQERANNQQTRSTVLAARRGAIYDRNMNTLAKSATVWNICISPADLADIKPERLEYIASGLAEILDIDKSVVIDGAKDRSKFYLRIKRRVDHDTMQAVMDFITSKEKGVADIKGVFTELDTKRYYTYGSLASTVLGFTNYDNQGAYGIESYYNKTLSGVAGTVVSAKDAKGADMSFKYSQINEARDGNSIVLTIDETLQHILERHLDTAVVEHSLNNKCAGIIMNIKTGEVLAMATKPDFDPNEPNELKNSISIAKLEEFEKEHPKDSEEYEKFLQQLRYDQWRNKAITDPYEPGSVFKIITAATAIDNNLLNLNEGFYCSGHVKVSDHTYGCWRAGGHGAQNFIQAMQNSCNPVFIAIGQRIGARMFYDYLGSFGFGQKTGVDLPGEDIGIMQSFDLLNKPGMIELSSVSFGQTFKVTPLQMITAASAAINGGYLMQPYIVKQVLDKDGNVLETTQPVVRRQVISEQTSETMQMLVEAVVDGGSGRFSAIPGYSLGGKTGTSEKKDILDREVYVLSFIGFAPMDDPQYAILVMLDEPREAAYGSTMAAPIVGAIYQEMLPYVGIQPQYTPEQLEQKEVEVPSITGMAPHDAQGEKLTALGLKMRIEGNGATILRQIPQAWQKMPKGGTVIVFTDDSVIETDIQVPDVVGMSAQEANRTLLDKKLNIELRGVTTDGVPTMVEQQWPLAGTAAQTGDVVIVTLVKKPEAVAAVADPTAVDSVAADAPADGSSADDLQQTDGEAGDVSPVYDEIVDENEYYINDAIPSP